MITPVPWTAERDLPHNRMPRIHGADSSLICECGNCGAGQDQWEANAAFIVRACNSFDAMRETLKWFADPENWQEEQLSEGFVYSAQWRVGFSPIEMARAALALAEGQL